MQMAANAVVLNGRQGRARIERFARLVRELETYLGLNTSALVDYGRRYRAGLPISTSRAESTVNSLVNMRMNKRADALVATRRSPRAAGPRCCGRRPALGRSASSDRLIIPTFVPLPSTPVVDAPQALSLAKEPQANVERYDALRQTREVRHAS
jgi:hypothetical protein